MSRPTYGYGADDPAPHDRPAYDDGYDDGQAGDDGREQPLAGGAAGAPSAGSGAVSETYGQVPRSAPGGGYGAPAASSPTAGEDGTPAADAPPVCPRHPDRVAYVRCQRCHRPACPECQRPAAVGILCVDCVRDLEREQRQSSPRTAMGGPTGTDRPIVTLTIIVLCVVGFLLQQAGGTLAGRYLMFAPYRALAMPWTFLTSGFLHGGVAHIVLNMYALWAVGQYLERTMGRWRYLAVYLVSIIAGHTAVLLLTSPVSQGWFSGTVGASAGIFGLFGSLFVVNRRLGAQSRQVLALIGINLVITFLFPYISWQGHIGGLVIGTATTALLFATRPRATASSDRVALARRSAAIHAGVIAAAVLVCAALVMLKVLLAPAGAFAAVL